MSGVDLQGRVAVVTGASLGIGRATAIALGKAGAQVVVNYRSHADRAREVVEIIQESGAKAVAIQGDVADLMAVEELVAAAVQHFGSPTVPSVQPFRPLK